LPGEGNTVRKRAQSAQFWIAQVRVSRQFLLDGIDRRIGMMFDMKIPVFLLLGLLPAGLSSQPGPRTAILYGSVLTDPGDRPVAGAEVRVGPTLSARTDSAGDFTIVGIPAGVHQVLVRHVGHQPIATVFVFAPGDSLGRDFVLSLEIPTLDTVRVARKSPYPNPIERGKMGGFDERSKTGIGHFLDTLVLQKEHSRPLSDILNSHMAATIIEMNNTAAIASSRGALSLREQPSGDGSDRSRGARRACYSQVFIDGLRVYQPELEKPLFNINSVSPDMLQGAEFYSGPGSKPSQYSGEGASCGTLLLWTK
jgi:hypothetical protein